MRHQDIYQEIENELQAGKSVAQATVIHTRGSTPRKEGSTMLVKADGGLFGTIGGGCGEAGVIQKARLSLLDGKHREELADLTEDINLESEGVCGGTLRVFIEPWTPGAEALALTRQLKALAEAKQAVLVHQVVRAGESAGDPRIGRRVIQGADGQLLHGQLLHSAAGPGLPLPSLPMRKPCQLSQTGGVEVYTERWEPTPSLVIVGAGHIAEPLEQMGRMAGFDTVVIDDRTLFANRGRFPHAREVICGPILDVVRKLELNPATYIVLVTRGHVLDMDALRVVMDRGAPVAYLGMIGSVRRIRAVFDLLEKEGYAREVFNRVHAPTGLNIGAETPAEIAISILAEMVAVRRRAGEDTRSLVRVSGVHPAGRGSVHSRRQATERPGASLGD